MRGLESGMRNHEYVSVSAYRLCVSALLACGLLCACGCRNGDKETVPDRDINIVMEEHVNDIMAIPGVVGVAIGALNDGTPYIRVLVVEKTDEIDREIPTTLEGHPVRVEVSGEIKPM